MATRGSKPQATNTATRGSSRQTQAAEKRRRSRLGSEGAGHGAKGRQRTGRPTARGHMGRNKAGSGQGSRKN